MYICRVKILIFKNNTMESSLTSTFWYKIIYSNGTSKIFQFLDTKDGVRRCKLCNGKEFNLESEFNSGSEIHIDDITLIGDKCPC